MKYYSLWIVNEDLLGIWLSQLVTVL